jgi:hypothetical protein
MASSMRRSAQALVEQRRERFTSRHPELESRRRLEQALTRAGVTAGPPRFETHWRTEEGHTILDAVFGPSPRVKAALEVLSIVMLALVVASIFTLASADPPPALYLLVVFTLLAILGAPFVALGLASQREADEAVIRRAIRAALVDGEER